MKQLLLSSILCFAFAFSQAQITSFPYTDDFESYGTCGTSCNSTCTTFGSPAALGMTWFNDNTTADAGNWIVDVNGTGSSPTGPTANGGADFNPGTSGGKYVYFETSSPCNNTSVQAFLYSPDLDLSAVGGLNMIFAYHMYGSSMGVLDVDVSTDGGATWTNEWTMSGDQGDLWRQDTVSMSAYAGQVIRVRFAGTAGTSYWSDMAIDDVTFYEPLPVDAGVTAYPSPGLPSCNLTGASVEATVTNFGSDTLTSVDVEWAVNGVAQTPFPWTGSLPSGSAATVILGTYSFIDGDSLSAYTTNPNMTTETGNGASNDTLSIIIQSGLAGSYSIDPSGSGDYLSFTDAIAALDLYGVCSAVTFDVTAGTYAEALVLTEVGGASMTNTITFQSSNGDPLTHILTNDTSSTSSTDITISFDGGDFINFENLTITHSPASVVQVVRFDNGSHFNGFDGNIIIGDTISTSTSTNYAVISSFNGSLDSMNTFNNNDIVGGSYGVYWYGGATTNREQGNVFTNNNVTNAYYRGMMIYYQEGGTFNNNYVELKDFYTGQATGIYTYYVHTSEIMGNTIINANYGYGLYLSQAVGTSATDKAYVANNFIFIGDSITTSTSYGIYMTGASNLKVMNNSVNMMSNGTTSRAAYVTGGANNDFLNNSLVNWGPGYAIYYLSGLSSCDNNNLYAPNGNVGYFSSAQATLLDWQNATGLGAHSVSGDPMYFSDTDLHTCNDSLLDAKGVVDSMLTMDIDGQMRDMNAFDIGADEFLGLLNFSFMQDSITKCSTDVLVLGGWQPATDGSFFWSSTGDTTNSITTTTAGTAPVDVVTACGSASASVYVENTPDAVANFSTVTSFLTAVCTDMSAGSDTWMWDFGDSFTSTQQNPTHAYGAPGQYIITLIVSGPCGSDTLTQIFEATIIGVDEVDLSELVSAYPNPVNNQLTIDFNGVNTSDTQLELLDVSGKLLSTENLNGQSTHTMDMSGYAKGVYLVRFRTDDGSTTMRITKQ